MTFTEVLQGESSTKVLEFHSESGVMERLVKLYMGEVVNPGSSFNMQAQFFAEGIFQ